MAESSLSTPVHTYHCLCSTLILTTTHDLQTLPRRQKPVQDAALILTPSVDITRSEAIETEIAHGTTSVLLNVTPERRPVIIRREDGFEKRTLLRCTRCQLVVGYCLDEAHWENDEAPSRPVYLLPGGLLNTSEMVEGKKSEIPARAEEN